VKLQSVDEPTKVRLVDTNDVDDLRHEIIRAFPKQLSNFGASNLVVRVPTETLSANTDPETVDPKTFGQVLTAQAILAEVLKPDIAGAKIYRVVEMLTKPEKASRSKRSLDDISYRGGTVLLCGPSWLTGKAVRRNKRRRSTLSLRKC